MDQQSYTRYKTLDKCRLCNSKDLSTFIEFGDFPLAGAFLKQSEIEDEKLFPMGMQFCNSCSCVQVDTVIPMDILFKNYFYFSSAIQTLKDHFGELADELIESHLKEKSLVVEIGCNDGVFLRHLAKNKIAHVGVDPATNVLKSIKEENLNVINSGFGLKVTKQIENKYGKADAVVSSFSFAHIDDMQDVMSGVKSILNEDGVFIFEIYYLGVVITEKQYDMMYHEHMSYYTIKCLDIFLGKYGFEIYDIKKIKLRSGSLRFYAQKKATGTNEISNEVNILRNEENKKGLTVYKTYKNYGVSIKKTKDDLLNVLNEIKQKKQNVIGYGASGRATVIMNYCGIGNDYLDYVVDDAPAKTGYFTPGTHCRITTWDEVESSDIKPDYALIFAWPFIDEVKKKRINFLKQGGKFIVPLPDVKIIDS
mgnify:CR=1 FL=1